MNVNTKRQDVSRLLLVSVLVFVASGVLAVAPHDHDPSEYCRVCSLGQRVEAQVDDKGIDSPQLEASTVPSVTAAADAHASVLVATPLRGPPASS